MGLGTPATSALVMCTVPAQRSGMASATMNAVRQTGMTLGIALLGTLMSLHAIKELSAQLNVSHVSKATEIARAAVIGHQIQPGTPQLAELTRDAFAGGFSVAMLWAGLVSLVMTAWLLVILHPRFRLHAEQAVLSQK
jgi:hypothetical protein